MQSLPGNFFKAVMSAIGLNQYVYSALSDFEGRPKSTPCIGLKYVLSGCEHYFIDDKQFSLQQGQLLLVNPGQNYTCQIDKGPQATGICIDISKEIIDEIYQSQVLGEDNILERGPEISSGSFEVFNHIYSMNTSPVTAGIASFLMPGDLSHQGKTGIEFFYSLAENLVKEQLAVQKQIQRLPARKKQTREELYKRLLKARDIMDDCYLESLSLTSIARPALLSEFYFMRSFKIAFGISPYQYIIKKRLKKALALLQEKYTIQETANMVGFADVPSFSKAFKAEYKVSPSNIKKT